MKILIQIKDNSICFKVRRKLTAEYKNMLNTNIISDNELIFTDDYIVQNKKIVTSFIKELTIQYNTSLVIIENQEISLQIIDIIKNITKVNALILKEDIPITYNICKAIINTNNIKYLNCFNMHDFMIDLFDKKNIIVECRNEILFFSKFMEENNLNRLSSIYYKKSIVLNLPLTNEDEEDFFFFCNLNLYLKTIHIDKAILFDIETIVDILIKCRRKNIKIIIHDDIKDESVLDYLKKFNEYNAKNYRIYFKISYSQKYLQKNILPQTNITILKLCCLIVLLIISITFLYVFYDTYKTTKNIENIQADIKKVIDINDSEKTQEIIEQINSANEDPEFQVTNTELASLISINDSTVAWIKVNGTTIDYSVVQADDNEYYLHHDFYKRNNSAGWVFMDYRNNPKKLDDNTIIYAHNRYSNATMFGTLTQTFYKNWYSNDDNLIISFDTLYQKMSWRVFSTYKIPVTIDYLTTNFYSNAEKLEFFNMLKKRSSHDFGVNLNTNDKIITLSTCYSEGYRYVLHAVLINKE